MKESTYQAWLNKDREWIGDYCSRTRRSSLTKVVPLTLLLPGMWGLGVDGVFLAEPISNFVGGLACFLTMYFTVYRRMKKEEQLHTGQS